MSEPLCPMRLTVVPVPLMAPELIAAHCALRLALWMHNQANYYSSNCVKQQWMCCALPDLCRTAMRDCP